MKFGFKTLLLTFTLALVAISVSVSSYISYSNASSAITKMITDSTADDLKSQADQIEALFADTVGAVGKVAGQFKDKRVADTAADNIEWTKMIANASGLGSAMVAYESGDAYWNQTARRWPNNIFAGDVTAEGFYKAAMASKGASVTAPYLGDNKQGYWISIVDKVYSGMISMDMDMTFLNEDVKKAATIPGSVALIMTENSTILASSSTDFKLGQKSSTNVLIKATQQENAIQEYTENGVERLLFSKRIKVGEQNWYFTLAIDKDISFAALPEIKSDAIVVGSIACLLSLIAAYLVIQLLYRPILSLKKTIIDLSQGNGDLTQRLQVISDDDLGQIADGVNKFIANLQSMMLDIQDASTHLQKNVVGLKDKSTQNAVILENHVSETEQVVTAIEQMNATANAMATDAANTALLTQKANDASDLSLQTVNQAQNTVSALVKEVDETAISVQSMSDKTDGINTILSVIGGIAEQTNLLALNAAIEAARAGEQGRGFAVVADEVRNLAGRTKESTTQIETALSGLLKGNQSVVESMDSTKERCQDTADGMGGVTTSLGTMMKFVGDINDLSTQIATAAEEQSSVTQEVSRNMSAINGIVGELDHNGKEVLLESENIATVNNQLVEIVGRFKL